MLVLSDGKHLFPIVKGMCAPEAGEGLYTEEWNVVFPTWMHAGYHSIFAELYDGNEAAWQKKMPPHDQTYMLALVKLGGAIIKPGDFVPAESAANDGHRTARSKVTAHLRALPRFRGQRFAPFVATGLGAAASFLRPSFSRIAASSA